MPQKITRFIILEYYGSSHGSQTCFVDIIEKFVKQPMEEKVFKINNNPFRSSYEYPKNQSHIQLKKFFLLCKSLI